MHCRMRLFPSTVRLRRRLDKTISLLTLCPLSDISNPGRLQMDSVTEAAAKLGFTDRYVRFLLKRGELSGRKLGHDWVVLSLDYKRRRKPKRRGKSEAAPGGLRQRTDEVWTEGGF